MNEYYKNQFVRDLAWVISSPSLFNSLPNSNHSLIFSEDFFEYEFKHLKALLERLYNDPSLLEIHIQSGNNRLLGKYFESLAEFWFLNSERFDLIDKSVQININGDTKGEFDFILRDKINNRFLHLEAAGKFYLSAANSVSWETFIGPNPNDNLKNKMSKLLNEQIHLSKSASGKNKLIELGIDELDSALMLKGYFFYHLNNFLTNDFSIPEYSNPNHNKGWWIRFGEIERLFDLNSNQWIILKRMNWISKALTKNLNDVIDTNTLLIFLHSYFEFNHYPILIASVRKNGEHFIEVSRGFIVSDLWPDLNFTH
jgi:hypothetical protein